MIARIFLPVILATLLAFLFIDRYHISRWKKPTWWKRLLWWSLGAVETAYTIFMAMQRDFAPRDGRVLNTYLFLLGLIVMPAAVFALCSATGMALRRIFHLHRNYGAPVGLALVAMMLAVLFYGSTAGFSKVVVRHIEYSSSDMPLSFDGYRIVQFSDAHVGTYGHSRQNILAAAVDSINAQQADAVVFVGDLQNMEPNELTPHLIILCSLRAKDGVFSVLGNHDYAAYIDADEKTKQSNCRKMVECQRQMGWTLLRNEHRAIRRGGDSIIVAGMENEGKSDRAPKRGDLGKTLNGVGDKAFVVLLQHDPTCWRSKILPQCRAQLTLSGHTHAAQFAIGGWSPAALIYDEWGGLYYFGDRAINVTTGLGGFVPFRFGVPGEIVVITLRKR